MSVLNPSRISDDAAGGIAYLTLIPAIVLLIVEPHRRSSFVRFHAWQSIFFFLAWAVLNILLGAVVNVAPSSPFLTLTILKLVGLAMFVVWLFLLIGAFRGRRTRLPLIGGLAERQSGWL